MTKLYNIPHGNYFLTKKFFCSNNNYYNKDTSKSQ